jgi:hypothetical protein
VNQTQRGNSRVSGQRLGELSEDHRDRLIDGDAFGVEPCTQIPNSRLAQVEWKERLADRKSIYQWLS